MALPSAAAFEKSLDEGDDELSAGGCGNGVIVPLITFRAKGSWLAVGFNQTDQKTIKLIGAAGMTLAVCAVAVPACPIAGAITTAMSAYITRSGICSSGRTLWWYDKGAGSVVACRSTAPW